MSEDVEIEAGQGKPVRVSFGMYVLVQVVMGGMMFGAGYATIRRDIVEQGKQIEIIQKRQDEREQFQQEALERLIRIEERLEGMRENNRRGR